MLDLSPASTGIALTGTNYLEMDGTVAGQLDDWAGTANTGAPAHTYQISQISSLTDAGPAGNDTLTLDLTNGNPLAAATAGIAFNTSRSVGGIDSLIINGDAHADSYFKSSTQILFNGGAGSTAFTNVPVTFSNLTRLAINAGPGPDTLSSTGTTPITYIADTGANNPIATLSSLSIANGSKVSFASPTASRAVLQLNTAAAIAGQLDLANNDMLIHGSASAFSTMNANVATGFNRGLWTSTGIVSSTAATNLKQLTALAVILNTAGTSFDGLAASTTDVLIKFTYEGDANLDGKVDGSDYSLIDNGYIKRLTGWSDGDFNYDGVVDGSDYTVIDNTFNQQNANLATMIAIPAAQGFERPFDIFSKQNGLWRTATRSLGVPAIDNEVQEWTGPVEAQDKKHSTLSSRLYSVE